MRKHSFLMFVGLSVITGCSSTMFDVAREPSNLTDSGTEEDSETTVRNLDAGLDVQDGQVSDADGSVICEPYSCKADCGGCDAGSCGSGGMSSCGSTNCSYDYASDASTFNCPNDRLLVFKCYHYIGQNTQDFMPRCVFRGGSTADGEYTRWCCPHFE